MPPILVILGVLAWLIITCRCTTDAQLGPTDIFTESTKPATHSTKPHPTNSSVITTTNATPSKPANLPQGLFERFFYTGLGTFLFALSVYLIAKMIRNPCSIRRIRRALISSRCDHVEMESLLPTDSPYISLTDRADPRPSAQSDNRRQSAPIPMPRSVRYQQVTEL